MEAYIMPTLAVLLCALAWAFKKAFPTWTRAHDFIPLGCAVAGIIIMCVSQGLTIDNAAVGAITGLAATGLWEQFTHVFPPVYGSHVEGD